MAHMSAGLPTCPYSMSCITLLPLPWPPPGHISAPLVTSTPECPACATTSLYQCPPATAASGQSLLFLTRHLSSERKWNLFHNNLFHYYMSSKKNLPYYEKLCCREWYSCVWCSLGGGKQLRTISVWEKSYIFLLWADTEAQKAVQTNFHL